MNDTEKYWNARPAALRRKQAQKRKKQEERAEVYRLFDQEHLTITMIAARSHHRRSTVSAWLKERKLAEVQPKPEPAEAVMKEDPEDARAMEYLFSINARCYHKYTEKARRMEQTDPWLLEAPSLKTCTAEQQIILKSYLHLNEIIQEIDTCFERIEKRYGSLVRRIVWLHYGERLSYRKTAERVGLSERQVRHHCDKFRCSCFDHHEISLFAKEDPADAPGPDFSDTIHL